MYKSVRYGVIHLDFEKNMPFSTESWALLSMQALELAFARQGLRVTADIDLEHKSIELSVYFGLNNYPKIPRGCFYTRRFVTSHTFYSPVTLVLTYVRIMKFIFEY